MLGMSVFCECVCVCVCVHVCELNDMCTYNTWVYTYSELLLTNTPEK